MISDRLKQRLVGAAVLVALAVIFIPMVFNLQPSRPVDETTRIPPAPDIPPLEIAEPVQPELDNDVPDHRQVFVPEEDSEPSGPLAPAPQSDDKALDQALEKRELPPMTAAETRANPASEPALGDDGLPGAWIIQVASFSEQATAQQQVGRLRDAEFKAFHQPATAGGKQVHRVLVGPFVSRQSAESEKKLIDRALGVDALILSFEP